MAGGNGLICSMNLKFDDFVRDFREVKEDHSETRRASALTVSCLNYSINLYLRNEYFVEKNSEKY